MAQRYSRPPSSWLPETAWARSAHARLDFDAACSLLGRRFDAAAHSRAQLARDLGLTEEELAAIMPPKWDV